MRQVRITVNAYEKALQFKNGELVRVLEQGKHWVNPWTHIVKYDVTELFYHEIDLDMLMKCSGLSDKMEVVEVADHEIAIQYHNGNFNQVLAPGRYAYWQDGLDYTYDVVNLNSVEVDESLSKKVLNRSEVKRYLTIHIVENYELGLLHIDGELVRELKPGMYYFWKGDQHVVVSKVDMRRCQVEVSGQELLTADKAAIRMSLFASFQVVDIVRALSDTNDYTRQMYVSLQLGLRAYVGQYTLDQLLANKSEIGPYLLDFVKDSSTLIGVEMLDVGLRDIILPGDVKDIMNQVLVAEKKAQANTIMRREETASTRSLLNTAKLMEDNNMLFRLKEMEYMEKIAERVGEISLHGGDRVIDQLRSMVGAK